MKAILYLLPLLWLGSCHAQSTDHSQPEKIAVIELFTSEGCSSCPPADELLSRYSKDDYPGVKIFALSFHVDYWNRLGWRDPFSSPAYAGRQRNYAQALNLNGVYTPQMIVNGTHQFVGSDESGLRQALSNISNNTAISITALGLTHGDAGTKAVYKLQGDPAGYEIHIAVISIHESTQVRRGENGGRTLAHTNVVRTFYTAPATASGQVALGALPADTGNTAVIAYLQNVKDGHIAAAALARP
jgi:hypothetical protein